MTGGSPLTQLHRCTGRGKPSMDGASEGEQLVVGVVVFLRNSELY